MKWNQLLRTKNINQLTLNAQLDPSNPDQLKKSLGVWDLTAFGVAAILGAGVFSTIGNAAADGGPAVVFLFIFTAVACAFSALCYAEFASAIPVSGSAYTYAYASFGELAAWIIGWDLLMEYAIGNIAVAISWSEYFTGLLASYGVNIPSYLTMDFLSASRGYEQARHLMVGGQNLESLKAAGISTSILHAFDAWQSAPRIFNMPLVCNLPALLITVVITWIVYIGIEESRKTSNFLVLLKTLVIILVIGIGATYINPANWVPFAPHGARGVLKGVSAVFFAYIGFDAVSTTAEECKNPQRDLPLGMIYSLVICTTLYALVSLVLTGMVSYSKLGVGDPLAFVFGPDGPNLHWLSAIINVSAVIALATVILVFQVGQPRIWMAMSRDGLLPPIFASIHPKYKTPWFSTLVTGLVVAVPSLFMNLTEVTDLTSIGTLFAFIIVCAGVLKLNPLGKPQGSKFQTPYVNSKIIFPSLLVLGLALIFCFEQEWMHSYFSMTHAQDSSLSTWKILLEKIPLGFFGLEMLILSYYCITQNLSLIPVLGLATCSYLITELGITNWIRFGVWLFVGFFVYFLYGIKNSHLSSTKNS
jgi:amino acid transporter